MCDLGLLVVGSVRVAKTNPATRASPTLTTSSGTAHAIGWRDRRDKPIRAFVDLEANVLTAQVRRASDHANRWMPDRLVMKFPTPSCSQERQDAPGYGGLRALLGRDSNR